KQLSQLEIINIGNPDELPVEAVAGANLLRQLNVQSFLGVPMVFSGKPMGFLALCSHSVTKPFSQDTVELVRVLAGILVSALERKRSDEKLALSRESLRKSE